MTGQIIIYEIKRNDKNKVVVRWQFPTKYESKISAFFLSRATKAEGPYVDINQKSMTKSTREITDESLTMSSYYQIRIVDVTGKEVTHSQPYFFHVEDNVPPAIPVDVLGTADKRGIVTLKWKANDDIDLLGYRVFSSNDLTHEFIEVTSQILSTNFYQDTINTRVLNKKIHYTIVAVDNNFNTSQYSKPCSITRPDLIAPVAAIFGKIEKVGKSINLKWINSVSSDVATYSLSRIEVNDTLRKNILKWNANKPLVAYTDNTAAEGKTYRYQLSVIDSAGNVATDMSREIKVEVGVGVEVTEFKALIDRENKIIVLRWNYKTTFKKCLLYRKKNDDSFTLYQSLEGSLNEFIDKQVTINNMYSYKIQLVLETNAKTEISKMLKVPF